MDVKSNLDFLNQALIVNLDPTTTRQGVIRLATQGEVNAGVVADAAVTPATLKAAAGFVKGFAADIGDGVALSFVVNHNLNTLNVLVQVSDAAGLRQGVEINYQRTSVNSVTIVLAATVTPPALGALHVVVMGFT